MIRTSKETDFPFLIELSRAFWRTTDYPEPFEEGFALEMMKVCHAQRLLIVLELSGWVVGFAAAIRGPLLGNGQVEHATELAYYVKPEHRGNGIDLLKGLERAARDEGLKYLNMVSMQASKPDVANHIYKKMGYRHTETVFRKEL